MEQISNNVFFVQGHKNGAIYNLGSSEVFSINDVACKIIHRALAHEVLSDAELDYVSLLKKNGLWSDSFSPSDILSEIANEPEVFDVVWLEITQACNMRCLHCYEGCNHIAASNSKRLSLDEWKNIIDQIARLGTKRVVVIGGEPTIDARIVNFLEYLGETGLKTTLFTNASFKNTELVDVIYKYNIRVKFSIYGHTPEIHDLITCHPGSFQRLVNNIKNLLVRDISVTAAIVLMRENEDYKDEIDAFVKSLGITHYKFDVIREVYSGTQTIHNPLRPEIIKLGKITEPFFNLSANRFKLFYKKNTCWNKKLVVTETGVVLPCVFARSEEIGNLRNATLEEVLNSSALKHYWGYSFDNVNMCKECEFRYACKDCRPLAMAVRGNIEDKNPRCCYNPLNGEWSHE